jgi:hypothetical protein
VVASSNHHDYPQVDRMGDEGLRREVRRLLSLFESVEDCAEKPAHIRDICTSALDKYREGALP